MVNWEILIGLLAIALTIYFGAAIRIPNRNDILRNSIAMTYAFGKASSRQSEKVINLEDIKQGFDLADRFKSQSERGNRSS